MENEILKEISTRYPFPLNVVRDVYSRIKSFDKTIEILAESCSLCSDPSGIVEKYIAKENTILNTQNNIMKKYIATDKHPEIRNKTILTQIMANPDEYTTLSETIVVCQYDIDAMVKNKWIQEIQENEFTKDDMIKYGNYFHNDRQASFDKWVLDNKK